MAFYFNFGKLKEPLIFFWPHRPALNFAKNYTATASPMKPLLIAKQLQGDTEWRLVRSGASRRKSFLKIYLR